MEQPTTSRVYTQKHDWDDLIANMHSGEVLEIDSDVFYYFLEVLPPVFMGEVVNGQRYAFGFAEGSESITGFWKEGKRFFCRDLGIINGRS